MSEFARFSSDVLYDEGFDTGYTDGLQGVYDETPPLKLGFPDALAWISGYENGYSDARDKQD